MTPIMARMRVISVIGCRVIMVAVLFCVFVLVVSCDL